VPDARLAAHPPPRQVQQERLQPHLASQQARFHQLPSLAESLRLQQHRGLQRLHEGHLRADQVHLLRVKRRLHQAPLAARLKEANLP